MKALDTISIIAASVRLTSILARDEITQPLRNHLDVASMGAPYGSLPERLSYLASCHKCASVWASAAVLGAWAFGGKIGKAAVHALAASQAAIMVIEAMDGEEK